MHRKIPGLMFSGYGSFRLWPMKPGTGEKRQMLVTGAQRAKKKHKVTSVLVGTSTRTCIGMCVCTYIRTYIHSYVHACIHACKYIDTYIDTCMHIYIHVCKYVSESRTLTHN